MRTFFNLMMIKAYCWNRILLEGSISNGFDKSGFSCILQSDNGYLKLFVEEFSFNPREYFVYECEHFYFCEFLSKTTLLL